MPRITFHGHRPGWACQDASAVQDPHARPATHVNANEEVVRTVHLGFIKIKVHRQTAARNRLLSMVTSHRNQAVAAQANTTPSQGPRPGLSSSSRSHSSTEVAMPASSMSLLREISHPSQGSVSDHEGEGLDDLIGLQDIPHISQTLTSRTPTTHEEYIQHWNDWAQAGGEHGGDRIAALAQLRECLNQEASEKRLSLASLGLTSLPAHLPCSIKSLNVHGNNLSCLPDNLPGSLKTIFAGKNQLTHLPANLPGSLKALYAGRNQLTCLPDNLPDSLEDLTVHRNRLTRLPDNLPGSLVMLDVGDNQLTRLPDHLPGTLEDLYACRNRLTSLPDHLPDSLQLLDVCENELTSLPESIVGLLQGTGFITMSHNPFSRRTMDALNAIVRAPGYQGPLFYFSMGTAEPARVIRPLADAVVDWFEADDQEAVRQTWNAFSNENETGQAAFSQFLDRLGETVNATGESSQFKQATAEWLSHLADHAPLKSATFMISQGATTSCEDRVSLTFNEMRKARLVADVENGAYDDRLPDLINVARGMFRLDKLEKIAREKVKSLTFVDEIEVYLAYQVKLRDRLDLPLDTINMRFYDVSYVEQRDLDAAEASVKSAEALEFSDYLSTEWAPWQSLLQRQDPDRHESAQAQLMHAIDTQFAPRLHAQLQELGLENDTDAQRTLGLSVQAEINREIMGELTRTFLASRSLSGLLN